VVIGRAPAAGHVQRRRLVALPIVAVVDVVPPVLARQFPVCTSMRRMLDSSAPSFHWISCMPGEAIVAGCGAAVAVPYSWSTSVRRPGAPPPIAAALCACAVVLDRLPAKSVVCSSQSRGSRRCAEHCTRHVRASFPLTETQVAFEGSKRMYGRRYVRITANLGPRCNGAGGVSRRCHDRKMQSSSSVPPSRPAARSTHWRESRGVQHRTR
jgi:hypothetical protein